MTKGILVNYEYCTGCHRCDVACKKYLGLEEGDFGIKLTETGPSKFVSGPARDKWEWTWLPVLTHACVGCKSRVEKGKMPMCVQHCQAWCMYYGEVEDLVKKMDGKTRWSLQTFEGQ
jgi:Fe-S-cluster-containing dehydrogenase component